VKTFFDAPVDAPRLAWLFDVDGTLLTTEGAATEAFSGAVADVLGIEDDLVDVGFAGRTEPVILADILAKHGKRFTDGDEARFWDRVFTHARSLMVPPRGRLMPGVPEILDRIARRGDSVFGLLTGNMSEMADIKLRRFGLNDRFSFGAFGEMAEDRNALARLAVSRICERYGFPAECCIVIGDTEFDIECARGAGARAVAVATGGRPRALLESREPDLLLDDLSDPELLFEWAERIERRAARPRDAS
jgi:phosphoglycolate phosphatase